MLLNTLRRKDQIMGHLEKGLDGRIVVVVLIGQLLLGYQPVSSSLDSLSLYVEELDVIE